MPAGGYDVCYLNAFETQPGSQPVTDEAWGEWLLDIRTDAKRTRLTRIVGRWIDRWVWCCATGRWARRAGVPPAETMAP